MSNDLESDGGPMVIALTNPLIMPLVPLEQREAVSLLWALDRRLARLSLTGAEPALAQIRLRWWADQLLDPEAGTHAEPLLQQVASVVAPRLDDGALAQLAEAWFDCVGSDSTVVQGRRGAILFTNSCHLIDAASPQAPLAGEVWAVFDHAFRGERSSADWALVRAQLATTRRFRLPRALAALMAQARSIASRDGARSLAREQISILRAGFIGR